MQKWVTADSAGKAKAWKQIQDFNRGKPPNAQISMKDLTASAKRRETEQKRGTYQKGLRVNNRDRHIAEEIKYYNTGN